MIVTRHYLKPLNHGKGFAQAGQVLIVGSGRLIKSIAALTRAAGDVSLLVDLVDVRRAPLPVFRMAVGKAYQSAIVMTAGWGFVVSLLGVVKRKFTVVNAVGGGINENARLGRAGILNGREYRKAATRRRAVGVIIRPIHSATD